MKCDKYSELAGQVAAVLEKLVEITEAQLTAFIEKDQSRFMQLDKELELIVGEKERIIGALREHEKEHRCQS